MSATDDFPAYGDAVVTPARSAKALTPSDTVDVTKVTRGFGINADGDVKLWFVDDEAAVTIALKAGIVYPYRVKRVYSTGTDAGVVSAGVIGYY